MKIKKITAFLLGCVMAVALLSACAPDKDAEYTVSFDYNYFTFDEVPARQTVRYGEKAEEPEEPEREGYDFLGWFTDADSAEQWDFEKDTVKGRTVRYAGWLSQGTRGEIVYSADG